MLPLSILSCAEDFVLEQSTDTFFHVSIDNTALPVWVRGNTSSKKIIVYINGGPGLTSIDLAKLSPTNWSDDIESEFAIAYYDQRGTGNAQGTIEESTITIEQYAKDLNAIIAVLKQKYEQPSIYLMSHSFGGCIALNHLLESDFQEDISGWISINGAFNFDFDLQWEYRHTFLASIADDEISKGRNVAHWSAVKDWVLMTPIISTREQKNQWSEYINNPQINIIPEEEFSASLGQYLDLGFNSSYNPFPAYASSNLIKVGRLLNKDVEGINYISKVSSISIPTLLIWGRYDDLIPPELGTDVFNNLGTIEEDKHFELFNNSSHEPYISDPKKFREEVLEFVERY